MMRKAAHLTIVIGCPGGLGLVGGFTGRDAGSRSGAFAETVSISVGHRVFERLLSTSFNFCLFVTDALVKQARVLCPWQALSFAPAYICLALRHLAECQSLSFSSTGGNIIDWAI
jgi:hypothetical protein